MGCRRRNPDSNYTLPDDILERSRCATCKFYVSCAPLQVLQKGGIICGRCTPRENDRPVYRNEAAERLLSRATFPCCFKERGCKKSGLFNFIIQHEDRCHYQNYFCPFVNCTWKGQILEIEDHLDKHEEMWSIQMHPCYLENCKWQGSYARRWEHFEKSHPKYVMTHNKISLDTGKDLLSEFFGKISNLVYGILLHFNADGKELKYSVFHPTRKNLQCFCAVSNYSQHDFCVGLEEKPSERAGCETCYYDEFLLNLKVGVYYRYGSVVVAVNFSSADMP